uniref:Uncharacterized protein n=1 Tax=Chromera velia CCMP2878 TaxID=1169474 RepID=A0A0G4FCY0_9ALVE|eukprot:Cvel_16262.t1-p1 / transcript=Cvel_16262.t1 / gene=Cvel_16262 / organism=Chromera_velia_CCMP2878 / gene_product=hypothetical protein / transcript_product=hypothetical protein / location=Cvel_scaffold1245:294-3876(+) / protein_length=437 / sequence_SO=supercontig / SO=protein_coding / is_pseudo=false
MKIAHRQYTNVISKLTDAVSDGKVLSIKECNTHMDVIKSYLGVDVLMPDSRTLEMYWQDVERKFDQALEEMPEEADRPCTNWCALPSAGLAMWAVKQGVGQHGFLCPSDFKKEWAPFPWCSSGGIVDGKPKKDWPDGCWAKYLSDVFDHSKSCKGLTTEDPQLPPLSQMGECSRNFFRASEKHADLMSYLNPAMMMSQAHLLLVMTARDFMKRARVEGDWWGTNACVDKTDVTMDPKTLVEYAEGYIRPNVWRSVSTSQTRAGNFQVNGTSKIYHCERPVFPVHIEWENRWTQIPEWRNISLRWDWLEASGGPSGGFYAKNVTLGGSTREVFFLRNGTCFTDEFCAAKPEQTGCESTLDPLTYHRCDPNPPPKPGPPKLLAVDGQLNAGVSADALEIPSSSANYSWVGPSYNWSAVLGDATPPPDFKEELLKQLWGS